MTAAFIGIAAVMVAVALALLLPPMLRRGAVARGGRQALNVAIYEDRLAELEQERGAGNLSDDAFEQARNELQRELLLDVEPTEEEREAPRGGGRWGAVAVGLFVPVLAGILYFQLGALRLLDGPASDSHPQTAGEAPQPGELKAMVAELQAQLQNGEGKLEDWLLLARAQLMLGQDQAAVETFDEAREAVGDRPILLTEQADAIARTQQGRMDGRPQALVAQALEADPTHRHGLWLAGVAATQHGDYPKAIDYWRKLLEQLPADGRTAGVVRESIARAEERLDGGGAAPADDAAAAAAVSLEVAIAPDVAGKAPADAAVFIFARAPDGGKRPLAAVRRQVKDLPVTVTLDESSAMGGGRGLGTFERVEVVARVSLGGGVTAQSGDLEGRAEASVGGSAKLTIDRILP